MKSKIDKIDARLRVIESWLLDALIEKEQQRRSINEALVKSKSDSHIPKKNNLI